MGMIGDGRTTGRRDYETPWPVVRMLEERWGPFTLDPCAYKRTKKAPRYLGPDAGRRRRDGLLVPWEGLVFMNPPYGVGTHGIAPWVQKAFTEAHAYRCAVVGLLPGGSRDADWWHTYCLGVTSTICDVAGRIKFILDGVPTENSPVVNVVVYWPRGVREGLATTGVPFNVRTLT